MEKTNFDLYLEEELRDPKFAERFKQAGEAWAAPCNSPRKVSRPISRRSKCVA